MPNRVLRDWTDSASVNKLSVYAERFFTRLIMKADDLGRYHANVKILKSTLFPYEADKMRDSKVRSWLNECEKQGIVLIYEIDGQKYLEIQKYDQRVRQQRLKFPPPLRATEENLTVNGQSIDGQLTVNGQTTDGLNETKRNEVEVETKASATKHDLFLNKFFDTDEGNIDRGVMATQLCVHEIRKRWCEVFNAHLHTEGKSHPTYTDWMKHFRQWVPLWLTRLQDFDKAQDRHKNRNFVN